MNPEDQEMEEFSRRIKKEAEFKEATQLPEAKLAFHRFVETEQDEIKREKLKEFIKFVDGAQTLEDINWFREKAIKTAAASRSLTDKAIVDEQARLVRKKHIVTAWIFSVLLVAVILGTGFGKTYYGTIPDGTEVEMESEAPEIVQVDTESIKLTFHHSSFGFNQYVVARLIAAGAVLMVCVFFTISKDV